MEGPHPQYVFQSRLARFAGTGAPHYFAIPPHVARELGGRQGLRLRVTVNDHFTDFLGLRRRGEVYFLSAGEKMRRRCRLDIGSEARVQVSQTIIDDGIPLPRAFAEVLRYEPVARDAFAKLSPGARRTLITRVRKTRTREGRIRISLRLAEELREGRLGVREL